MIDTSKVIHAPVGGGRYTVTAPIVKEDYGLYLKIEGLELPSTYEVDFSNSEHNGTSVTMIGNSDGVLIPSQFISSGKDVFAFLYHVGVDFGRTVYKFRIPNKLRPDRTNEQPTPEEQSTIDQAISALNSAVEQTAQDKADADVSAQNASADAERAEEARTDAQNYAMQAEQSATNAQTYASQASASATASAQSASQSAQIKADVEDMVDEAQASATASAQSATASANSASQASGYAQSASASASSAQGYASNAQSYSQTASAKAQDASQSATTASTKASEASTSASQALTYKTDAESAKTASQTAQGLAEQAKADAITAKNDAESARDEAQNLVDGISGKVEQIDSNTERIESLEDDRYKPYVTDSASGSIASFPDGADDIPLKSLVVDINPVQDLSNGDPSPENICPISGWTGCEVNATGVNVFDGVFERGTFNNNGTPANSTTRLRTGFIRVQQDYAFITVPTANVVINEIYRYDANKQYISKKAPSSASNVVEIGSNVKYIRFSVRYSDNSTITLDDGVQALVKFGRDSAEYESYNGRSIPINWQTEAGTVYGGSLDVLSGKLYVGYGICKVKDLSWSLYNTAFYATKSDILHGVAKVDVRCDRYKTAPSANGLGSASGWPDKIILGNISTASVIYIKDTTYTSVSEFKTAQGEMDIVYPLATPIEIQLTPHEVNSLLGQNNIFADTGDTEVEYRADTKLYIERLTEPDADMIADSNIVSGQYFMVGNSLFKATANIASGAQVIVGTNATRKSLSEALNEINA